MTGNRQSEIIVERASVYTPELGRELGQLMLHLTDSVDGSPIDAQKLQANITSPNIEQLVAYDDRQLVGAATLTQLGGLAAKGKAWLEDFVVAPEARGTGAADAVADEWEQWCHERGISLLLFTSGWGREAAHRFYLRRGAYILNRQPDVTAFFNYPIPGQQS